MTLVFMFVRTALIALTPIRSGFFGALLLLLAGCAQDPPSCNDPSTSSKVKNIFREQLLPKEFRTVSAELFERMTRLELAAPEKFEKEIGKYSCAARFSVDASKGIDIQGMVGVLAAIGSDASLLDGSLLGWLLLTEKERAGETMNDKGFTTDADGTLRYKFDIRYTSQRVDQQQIVRVDGVLPVQSAVTGALVFLRSPSANASQPPTNPTVTDSGTSGGSAKNTGATVPIPTPENASLGLPRE